MDLAFRHLIDRNQIAANVRVSVHHLLEAARRAFNNDVRQQDRKRIAPDNIARTPDSMAEAPRRLLAHKTHRPFLGAQAFHLGREVGFTAHL